MSNPIVIRRGFKIGNLDAETDGEFLAKCFIDSEELNNLVDTESYSSIIVGRTGSGKSALLRHIGTMDSRSKLLNPSDISINFLEHSNILQFFAEVGVKIDLFYRLLWRHILVVELLKLRYPVENQNDVNNLKSRFLRLFERDELKIKALNYFFEWSDKFWLETSERLKELTSRFEKSFRAGAGINYSGMTMDAAAAQALSQEQRTEIKSLSIQYVSKIQIKKLNELFDLLANSAFNDRQKKYYILIDDLDQEWATTETRCRFIRALIEEVREFRKLPNTKIVIALRKDLLDLILDRTRESGFQWEKYNSYITELVWSKSDLKRLVDKRVNEGYKKQYTSESISVDSVFPSRMKRTKVEALDYMLERTLMRPRDVISFANECFKLAVGNERISWKSITEAEKTYSRARLGALIDEWSDFYPSLPDMLDVLRGSFGSFNRSQIDTGRLDSLIDKLCDSTRNDTLITVAKRLTTPDAKERKADFLTELLFCLYHAGAVGVKISTNEEFQWSYIGGGELSRNDIKRGNKFKVHPMLYWALDVKDSVLG